MTDMGGSEERTNGANVVEAPDSEVVPKARRRKFSAEYKLRILREADACNRPGEIGALLRREGLYSSLLSDWRRQRDAGALARLSGKKRGRKPTAEARRVAELERENERLRHRLGQAETIIAVQKKLAQLLKQLPESQDEEPE
jgi:transposase-like protein